MDLGRAEALRAQYERLFQRFERAAMFDCDVSLLEHARLEGLAPRPIVLSTHPTDVFREYFQALLQAEEDGIEVTTMPMIYEDLLGRVPISLLKSDWILRSFVDEARANGRFFFGQHTLRHRSALMVRRRSEDRAPQLTTTSST